MPSAVASFPQNAGVANASDLITRLRRSIDAELTPLRPGGRFALVDFPAHSNVGDAAIWLGELAFFRRVYGAAPAYVSKMDDFDAADCRRAIGDGTIFIHGGGNFGDLWPAHHEFRMRLLEACPHNPVVQLPQSIHFRDPRGLEETARAAARHARFTLLVRDRRSLELARQFPCVTRLCCDSAVYMDLRRPAVRAEHAVLCLLRGDEECARSEALPVDRADRPVVDWIGEPVSRVRAARVAAMLGSAARGRISSQHLRAVSFEAAARARVARGACLLSSGRVLVTDRLHAHILAVLLGIPHAVLDNNYGKLSSFIAAWTSSWPEVSQHGELAGALAWAEARAAAICGRSE